MNGTRVPSGRSAIDSGALIGRLLQGEGHRELGMGQQRAVRAIKTPSPAPSSLPELGPAARQLDGRLIVERDLSVGVGGVDGGRQPFQQLMQAPLAVPIPGRTGPLRDPYDLVEVD